MPRRELSPQSVWLIGVPLNLLLAIPCFYPVALGLLAFQVIAGELGLTAVDPTVVDDGAGIVITLGLVALGFAALVAFGLNALFAFRAPALNKAAYWLATAALIVIPNIVRLALR
ncbi:hypothetical protein [Amycolatopsis kentuckyensis]|uniref:hypothetical protein n=1 Tax=Amycolatopsis kentuckyensis TaxID=218823 RepID=UPI000A378A55|nr:hypothetical protein [Amycolatopsis kentuckyensis]